MSPSPASAHSHSRSSSFATPNGGSFGREGAKRVHTEFNKYTEDDEEDYDDIFGKPNGAGMCGCIL